MISIFKRSSKDPHFPRKAIDDLWVEYHELLATIPIVIITWGVFCLSSLIVIWWPEYIVTVRVARIVMVITTIWFLIHLFTVIKLQIQKLADDFREENPVGNIFDTDSSKD